ncbi:TetR/AcrR family transcriptional regulator [Nocardia xishanensis]
MATRAGLSALRTEKPSKRRIDAARREELLALLEELVLKEGFASFTVDELSTRLQCSKSTLYAIAPTKGELVLVVIKRFFRNSTVTVEESVADIDDPSEKIATYLRAVGTGMRRMSAACYADMVAFGVTSDIYAINSQAAAERVRQFIHEGVEQGAFRAVHAEFIAEAVSGIIERIQDGRLLKRTGLSSGDAFSELSAFILAALTNKN